MNQKFKPTPRGRRLSLLALLSAASAFCLYANSGAPDPRFNDRPSQKATTISLQTSSATAYPGSLVLLTATVTPSNAEGNVTFFSGAKPLGTVPVVSGSAAFTTHFETTGGYTLTATFHGAPIYAASTSAGVSETVESSSHSLDLSTYTPSSSSATYNSHSVTYETYSNVIYAANPVDTTYESMNIFIPTALDGVAVSHMPVMLEIGVGGYMSSPAGASPGTNGTYSMSKGYVVVEVGCRGRDNGSSGNFYGVAPAAMVDLKAAVRFLRYNAANGAFSGDVDRIVDSGGSAGGALSSLLGASGNSDLYFSYLAAIGAADAPDNIFAVGAWSPITNLNHADGAYEEEYSSLPYNSQTVNATVSADLKTIFESYQDSLRLRDKRGSMGRLTHSNITQYILEQYLEPSLANYVTSGGTAPTYAACSTASSGVSCTFTFADYVANSIGVRGKSVPAFDAFFDLTSASPYYGTVVNTTCTAETLEFGDPTGAANGSCSSSSSSTPTGGTTAPTTGGTAPTGTTGAPPTGGGTPPTGGSTPTSAGSPRHFTDFSSQAADGVNISSNMQTLADMMNPMYYIMNALKTGDTRGVARYWYIRDGTIATDTSAYVIIDLATALENLWGTSHVNASEDWGQGHNVEVDPSGFSTWVTDSLAAHVDHPHNPR